MRDATPPVFSLHATRWKPLLAGVVFSGGLVVDLLAYFVWPTPTITSRPWAYQEPTKTIVSVLVFLGCGVLALLGLYWAFTPRPMVQLDAAGFTYRPFPLPTRRILWADTDSITATALTVRGLFSRRTTLTLWFKLKSPAISEDVETPSVQVDIEMRYLSFSAQALVKAIRTYHPIRLLPEPTTHKVRRPNRHHQKQE